MKNICKYLLIACILTSAACNRQEMLEEDSTSVRISANIGLISRVSEDGTSFTNGDKIKVENTTRGENNLAEFTYNSDKETWNTADLLLWEGSGINEFKAWHPTSGAFAEFTIPTDQTSGLNKADWMTARSSVRRSDGDVILSFTHHLSKIVTSIEAWGNEFSAGEKTVSRLEMLSLSTTIQNDGTSVSGDNDKQYITAYASVPDSKFAAILSPGTYPANTEIFRIYTGGSNDPLTVRTSEEMTVTSGKEYSFRLTVGKDVVTINEGGVSVGDWITEDLGELTFSDATFELDQNTPDRYDVSYEGGQIDISLNTSLDYEISVVYNGQEQDWITASKIETKANASQGVSVSVLPNTGNASRSADIMIRNEMLDKTFKIAISQIAFTGIDASGFNEDKYLQYVSNYYSESSGGVFDTDISVYRTYFLNPCRNDIKWEFKFKLNEQPRSDYYLMSDYVGRDNTKGIRINSYGIDGNSWASMGIEATDVITVTINSVEKSMTVNGKSYSLSSSIYAEYFFSGYYYDRDDGAYSNYYGFQNNARLYYVKAWDANDRLVYLGGASRAYNSRTAAMEACWKATYYDYSYGTLKNKTTYAYYRSLDSYTPFGNGNLLEDNDNSLYPKSAGTIRLVSYNVGVFNKYTNSISMVADIIKELDADVVGMNEVDSCTTRTGQIYQAKSLAEQLGNWHYYYGRAMAYKGGAYGNAIVMSNKFNVTDTELITIPKGSGSEQRSCAILKSDRFVYMATHLEVKTSEARLAGVELITDWAKTHYGNTDTPVFLCGDMNCEPDDIVIDELCKEWTLISTTKNTYPSVGSTKCIDFIFALKNNAKYDVLGSDVPTAFTYVDVTSASDHLPVYTDIRLK